MKKQYECFIRVHINYGSTDLRLTCSDVGRVPGETFLIELNDDLRAFNVGLFGQHKIRVFGVLPLHEEHEDTAAIGGT